MREAGGTTCLCSDAPEQTRLHNDVNEIDTNNLHGDGPGESIAATTGSNWFDPTYDAAGNMIGGPKPGDEDETTGTQQWYKYDGWNRLVEVWEDGGDGDRELDGEGSDDVLVAKYRFDGLNRRIFKLLPNGENWDRTDYYYTAQWQVIEERTKTAADETTIADKVKYQYVWGLNYIDGPVVRHENGNGDDDTTDTEFRTDYHGYYTYDANFNVTSIRDVWGLSGDWYVYEPYGQEIGCTWDISAHNEIRFAGYRYDPETGLYHVRHRMYHPTLGRWIQRDPRGYSDGSNVYMYVWDRPTIAIDPSGRQTRDPEGGPIRGVAPMFGDDYNDGRFPDAYAGPGLADVANTAGLPLGKTIEYNVVVHRETHDILILVKWWCFCKIPYVIQITDDISITIMVEKRMVTVPGTCSGTCQVKLKRRVRID